jgi:mono/diheme cytochrome c family protein
MNIKRTLIIAGLSCSTIFNLIYADGAKSFKANCNMCHGIDGANTALGKALKARNLSTEPFKMGGSKEQIAETIRKGLGVMASFAHLSEPVRLELAEYILSLRSKNTVVNVDAKIKTSNPEKLAPIKAIEKLVTPVAVTTVKKTEAVKVAVKKPAKPVAVNTTKEIKVVKVEVKKTPEPVLQTKIVADFDLARAKKVYKKYCASCHGPKGKAASPQGIAMKARDFTSDVFKNGDSEDKIYDVITNGLNGTAMAGFGYVSEADRKLLAKLVKSLKGTAGISREAPKNTNYGSQKISITHAMQLLAKDPRDALKIDFNNKSKGWHLFQKNCAECHGSNGEGGLSTIMVSAAPMTRLKTEALLGHDGYWLDKDKFTKLVTEGLSGGLMPGNGTLTKTEINDLFQFFVDSAEK